MLSFMSYDLQISLHWLFLFLFLLPLFSTLTFLQYQRFQALHWTRGSSQPFPVSDFSRHALNFSFRIILAVDSLHYCLYYSCIWSLYHYSLQDFYQERCCNFSKAFSALITPSFGFCLYIYFMYCITFIDLYMLTNPCISWMKPNWLWSCIS